MAKDQTAISPTRAEDYPEWYQQVIKGADLAETSDVRGCMVIKPWGYALWENIQRRLDEMFKATGHENAGGQWRRGVDARPGGEARGAADCAADE